MQSNVNGTWSLVSEYIKDNIIQGTLSPGEKINERDVAGILDVSRTPVREALKYLESSGFVTNVPNRGVFVKKYTPIELEVIHRMLMRLEGLAVEMSVQVIKKRDINKLQKLNDQMKGYAAERNYKKYLISNDEFHLLFPRLTQSNELLETISMLRERVTRFHSTQITMQHDSKLYVLDHQNIIDALKEGRKGLSELMETHVDRTRRSFVDFYKNFGL